MSGGVDSSVAALLVMEKCKNTAGATMRLHSAGGIGDAGLRDVADAKLVADHLGIPHYVFELEEEFKKYVIDYFVNEYKACRTPNPCVVCNRHMKFDMFFREAEKYGFTHMATGHYAKIGKQGDRAVLQKAADLKKDQSYFLYSLTNEQLKRTLFPLGDLTKQEIRNIAEEHGFITAKKTDSQDVCFIPDGDYAGFIERYTGETFPEGKFLDTDGNILGTHKGIIRYTVGQRKGLGLSLPCPMYVCEKRKEDNSVILCKNEELFSKTLDAGDFNWSACDLPSSPIKAEAKIRYSSHQESCTVIPTGENTVHIEFSSPQRAPSKGQAVVVYDGNTVIGGGTIL